ncbi:MAG: hypothetical protein V3T75_01775, partial [candidate division Zixibacteria bacterium]
MRESFGQSLILKTIVFTVLLSAVFASTGAATINISCDTTEVTSHFTLIFEGVTYDISAGTSKWDY